jgi:DNA-3-methyladenine glycosylase
MKPLTSEFFNRSTITVARSLIGTCLIHRQPGITRIGRIVETEAYITGDPANHAYRGETKRNAVMFGPPGNWYIFFVYGRHFCLNVTAGNTKVGEAVLIRALEPIEGIEAMQQTRQKMNKKELCNGPARLVQAMGISPYILGKSALEPPLMLGQFGPSRKIPIATSPRIGIRHNKSALLRFYLSNSPFISH